MIELSESLAISGCSSYNSLSWCVDFGPARDRVQKRTHINVQCDEFPSGSVQYLM